MVRVFGSSEKMRVRESGFHCILFNREYLYISSRYIAPFLFIGQNGPISFRKFCDVKKKKKMFALIIKM